MADRPNVRLVRLLRHADRLGRRPRQLPLRLRPPPRRRAGREWRRPTPPLGDHPVRHHPGSLPPLQGGPGRRVSPSGRANAASRTATRTATPSSAPCDSWQPFHDTRPALTQARAAGLKLAILSNTDRDIIAHSLKHLDVPFDVVVTAEDCGSYKPSPANFERLLARTRRPAEDVLHVAFGFKYDIGPANDVGMRSAWVNRHVEETPPGAEPDHVWRDLWGLPRARRRWQDRGIP